MNTLLSTKSFNGQIRIIGGQWRGRRLPVLNGYNIRPTTDRARETLFNWLVPYIQQARCLDCFAGSGVLGIESLSRYAYSATLLELNYYASLQIIKNLKKLNSSQGKVIHTNTLKWLRRNGYPFNIVFVDPPFYKDILKETLILLEKNGWLANNALIYVENKAKDDPSIIPLNWKCFHEKITKNVAYRLYQRYKYIT